MFSICRGPSSSGVQIRLGFRCSAAPVSLALRSFQTPCTSAEKRQMKSRRSRKKGGGKSQRNVGFPVNPRLESSCRRIDEREIRPTFSWFSGLCRAERAFSMFVQFSHSYLAVGAVIFVVPLYPSLVISAELSTSFSSKNRREQRRSQKPTELFIWPCTNKHVLSLKKKKEKKEEKREKKTKEEEIEQRERERERKRQRMRDNDEKPAQGDRFEILDFWLFMIIYEEDSIVLVKCFNSRI